MNSRRLMPSPGREGELSYRIQEPLWKGAMSALGQKQTCAVQNVMSALPRKRTCAVQLGNVRFTPESLVAKLRWDTTLSPRSAICAF